MRLYHGGPAGLSAGRFILPANETKVYSCSDAGVDNNPHRRDRIYLTPDPRAAEMFAAMAPSLAVRIYAVEAVGDLEPDPDCFERGLSFQGIKAEILKEKRVPKARRKKILRALGMQPTF